MEAEVECYAGYRAEERPLRFRAGDREYMVQEVLERWYGPEESGFRVRVAGGTAWVLRLSRDGQWTAQPA